MVVPALKDRFEVEKILGQQLKVSAITEQLSQESYGSSSLLLSCEGILEQA